MDDFSAFTFYDANFLVASMPVAGPSRLPNTEAWGASGNNGSRKRELEDESSSKENLVGGRGKRRRVSDVGTWTCHVCNIAMKNERRQIQRHTASIRHQRRLPEHERIQAPLPTCPKCHETFEGRRGDALTRHQRSARCRRLAAEFASLQEADSSTQDGERAEQGSAPNNEPEAQVVDSSPANTIEVPAPLPLPNFEGLLGEALVMHAVAFCFGLSAT
ncbi:hypothetical protein AcW2_004813 [Taiwanofungus camphoratus]|nr:hypothetical protein AcW2_004813 [Antrodia cinnamomea]